jgi:hypothetical protein
VLKWEVHIKSQFGIRRPLSCLSTVHHIRPSFDVLLSSYLSYSIPRGRNHTIRRHVRVDSHVHDQARYRVMHCAGKTPARSSFANKSGQFKVGISPGVMRLDDSVRHPFILQGLVVRELGELGRVIQLAAENIYTGKNFPPLCSAATFSPSAK